MFGEIRLLLAGAPTSATLTVNIPNSLTIDTTKLPDQTNSATSLGNVTILDSGSAKYTGIATYNSATSLVIRNQKDNGTAVTHTNVTQAAPVTFAVNDEIHISFAVPIANWSSNVQMADRAVEEYAYNTSTSTASDSISFGYGAAGVSTQAFATSGIIPVSKRVRFQTPIQATDRLVLEFSQNGSWTSHADSGTYPSPYTRNDAGTTAYGSLLAIVNSTDVDANFYSQPFVGQAWGTAVNWRVRKVSSGAQIGGAISTANIVGRVDGSTVGSGYIGESLTFTLRSTTGSTGAVVVNASALVTLTPGVWIVYAYAGFSKNNAASAVGAYVSTNSVADFTGLVAGVADAYAQVTTATQGAELAMIPRSSVIVAAGSTQGLFAKSYSEDAAVNVDVRGFAVRIA